MRNFYLKLGERERPAAHYARFVELLKDCDPNLRQLRNAAEAKITQLRGARTFGAASWQAITAR